MLSDSEKKELEILEAIEAGHLSKEEGDELLQLESAPQEEEPSMGAQAFDYAMRGLDYAGGVTRTGIAEVADLATDKDIVQEGDWEQALKGKAPGTSEFLDRGGVQDSIGRDMMGFAGDVLMDPTSYLTGGASAIGKIGKMLKPAKAVTKLAGNKMIASGVSTIDEGLELAGKGKLSDIMIKNNIAGTNKTIKKKVDKLSNVFASERKQMFKEVADAGGKVDTTKIMDEFAEYTSKLKAKTGNQIGDDIVTSLEEQLLRALPETAEISLQTASNIKSQVRKSLPDNFYGAFGQVKDEYKQGVDKISSLFQKNIEKSANKVVPGMGDTIAKKNKDWSVLLDADSPLGREARKAAGKNLITPVDAMVTAGSFAGGGKKGAGTMLAAKKTADLMKTTVARTRGGQAVKAAGAPLDTMIRRKMINYNREE